MIKLKKDGTPKKSGGARSNTGGARANTGPKMKNPENLPSWDKQLDRALRLASNNNFILKRDSFFSKTQIKEIYGKKAHDEFSHWFNSVLRFDPERVDKIRQKQALGLYQVPPPSWNEKALGFYTPEKYADWLVDHKCYGWISVVHTKHHLEVFKKYADNGKIR